MTDGITLLEELHAKTITILEDFKDLPEKDIRKKHIEVISSQVALALVNLRINMAYSETSKQELKKLFNFDEKQIGNYAFNLIQTLNESIMEAALFQTELVFRFYYSKLNETSLAEKATIPKMASVLFQDTENNWTKDEAALIPLFWTLRNTVHTGGIYFDKEDGRTMLYKQKEYKFEYGKAPEFLKEGHYVKLVSDLLDSLLYLFKSNLIKDLGSFEHPSYYALGY